MNMEMQASSHWAELEQEAASWQAQAEERSTQVHGLEQRLEAAQAQTQQSSALAEVRGDRWAESIVLAV
jgi:uncharacterized protein YlxW (UPF0749 family)